MLFSSDTEGQLLQFSIFNTTASNTSSAASVYTNPSSVDVLLLAKQPVCSEQRTDWLLQKFARGRSKRTRCPQDTWLSAYYTDLYSKHELSQPFLSLSVGCNKAFDAINTMRMGTLNALFDKHTWKDAMMHAANTNMSNDAFFRAVCDSDSADQYAIPLDAINGKPVSSREGEFHCIEPMPSTFRLLKESSDALSLQSHGFTVTHGAVSNVTSVALFPNVLAGFEDVSLSSCDAQHKRKKEMQMGAIDCVEVPVYKLDDYVEQHVKGTGPIDVLDIDVEGYDYEALMGAKQTLSRTHYLMFEYNSGGNWPMNDLKVAINMLDEMGFTCYWAGISKLWRITNCWSDRLDDEYGRKQWSNVACVHRSQEMLAQRMERMFNETVAVE